MLIYGDRSFIVEPRSLYLRILDLLSCGQTDSLRLALAEAGQLEQALSDAYSDTQSHSQSLTDHCANRFIGSDCECPHVDIPMSGGLEVKVPEGYAFYRLYPEQYVAATEQWLREHPSCRSVLVVGIRSIGTSLSAVVQAVLRQAGKDAMRITVRPTGDPFRRLVKAPPPPFREAAIVVDEGPGLSGSSMASVADWLELVEYAPHSISFFPAHQLSQGSNVAPEVAARWQATSTYVVEPDWVESSLSTFLEHLLHEKVSFQENLHTTGPFSRSKLVFRTASGKLVLAKWAGFAALGKRSTLEECLLRQRRVAAAGFGPEPLGAALGYVFLPFAPGDPPAVGVPCDLDWMSRVGTSDFRKFWQFQSIEVSVPPTLREVARYIRECPGDTLRVVDVDEGLDRLETLIKVNIGEMSSPALAESLLSLRPTSYAGRASGDGDLSPNDWIAASGGGLVKTGCWDHAISHSFPGVQTIEWDVASAIVEWNMPPGTALEFADLCGITHLDRLPYYVAGYCAFKAGMLKANRTNGCYIL